MMQTTDLKTLQDTLIWLARQGQIEFESIITGHMAQKYMDITAKFPSLDVDTLEAHFNRCPKSYTTGKRFLYLPSETHGGKILPILSLEFNFETILELRLQLAIFEFKTESYQELEAVGFRFETPEGANEEGYGHHNYYHTQMFTYFRPNKGNTITGNWCPDTTPAIPLDAKNPIQLLISMLCSVYNMNYAKKMVSSSLWSDLVAEAREMQHYLLMPKTKK